MLIHNNWMHELLHYFICTLTASIRPEHILKHRAAHI